MNDLSGVAGAVWSIGDICFGVGSLGPVIDGGDDVTFVLIPG